MGILDTFQFYQGHDLKHDAFIVSEWLFYNCLRYFQPSINCQVLIQLSISGITCNGKSIHKIFLTNIS